MLHERGQVPYGNDKRLETNCYDEVGRADVVVSIIGGRYGSESKQQVPYSISQVELKTAIESGKQVFIFVERQVFGEYSTYQKNKDLEGFRCSYVDNPLVYKFIDEIYALPLNNAIKDFDRASDITLFLREQWAGLFQRYLQERERINEQSLVKNLQSTASTLQNLVTYFNKSETDKSAALQDLLLTAHPVFQYLQTLLKVGYRVFFTTRNEMSAWLKVRGGRGFVPVETESWDDEEYAEWIRNDEKGYDLLKVANKLFDPDGRLKGMAPSDWSDTFIKLSRVNNAPTKPDYADQGITDDDIPF